MQADPLLVSDLRVRFKAGATPSALIRVIAERHAGDPQIDRLVRACFREAFLVPMLQIDRGGVEWIAQGGEAASLNRRVLHQMVAARGEWDTSSGGDAAQPSWLDSVTATDEAEMLRNMEAEARSGSPAWWDQLGDEGKRFVTRLIANARSESERVQIVAALAERLQQQLHTAHGAEARQST